MTKTELQTLKTIRIRLNLTRFSAGMGSDGDALTATVKEATRLYRETWLIPDLDALISKHDPIFEARILSCGACKTERTFICEQERSGRKILRCEFCSGSRPYEAEGV